MHYRYFEKVAVRLPQSQNVFLEAQIKNANKKKHGQRYSDEDKAMFSYLQTRTKNIAVFVKVFLVAIETNNTPANISNAISNWM